MNVKKWFGRELICVRKFNYKTILAVNKVVGFCQLQQLSSWLFYDFPSRNFTRLWKKEIRTSHLFFSEKFTDLLRHLGRHLRYFCCLVKNQDFEWRKCLYSKGIFKGLYFNSVHFVKIENVLFTLLSMPG